MNAEQLQHPDRARLAAFAAGRLETADSAELEAHLANCSSCADVLQGLPEDTLVDMLKGADTLREGLAAPDSPTNESGARDWKAWTLPADVVPPLPPAIPADLAAHPRYEVQELLGVGGMGAVYKAEHRVMRRQVALKTISPALTDKPDAVERFNRESRAAACLSHPNIVTAHDADQAGATHFLVMEYVQGTTLARLVQERGPLPVAAACDYIRQAALGLQHAHERHMVHRDIKPQNLMLTPEGTVKVLDFGLARFVRESTASAVHTEVGAVMGTPDYMAPEQALDTRQADIRADIYSLGCTLYFLLSGRTPFTGETTMAKLMQHQQAEPRPIREIRPEVSRALDQVLRKMMARQPSDRYQTPAEVAQALTPFAKEDAAAPTQRLASPRFKPGSRSRRGLWLAAAAAVFLVLGGAALLSWNGFSPTDGNKSTSTDHGNGTPPGDTGKTPPKPGDPATPGGGKDAVGTWEVQKSGVKDALYAIHFVNDQVGVAVGEDTTVLKTSDGGKTWRRVVERKEGYRLDRILFSSPKEGWAIASDAGVILHTTDGGDTWQYMPAPDLGFGGHLRTHAAVGPTYFTSAGA